MLISRHMLAQLLESGPGAAPLPDDDALGDTITSLGLEVEGVERHGEGLEPIIVAEVRGKRPHPEADRLTLVEVFDGGETQEVVCGAPNVPEAGGRIAFAPVGTRLPDGLEIAARTIRGVQSRGMICSETELKIGPDADGIMVLPPDWTPGDRLIDRVPGIVDTVFELGVTPNRPDALGHVGVARDLAVKLQCGWSVPPSTMPTPQPDETLVTLDAPDRCGRYFGFAFEGARVGTSPLWLRVRLHRLGLRPINDVVDITNLVLMEWGQPLHAFDRANLDGGRVVVRMAKDGETMVALDGSKLEPTTDDLVIADASRPQALAGVMGGARSGVESGTTRILLEAAWFAPAGVRHTSRRLGLSSDSAYRFERGVDHGPGLAHACARACQLIGELTGARCVAGHHVTGVVPPPPTITLRHARVTRVLGMPVPPPDAKRILTGLELEVDDAQAEQWQCTAPSHRPDLAREEDLIEELMRHHGLDALPPTPTMPTAHVSHAPTMSVHPAGSWDRADVAALVDALAAGGLHEMVGFAFGDPRTQTLAVGEAAMARAVAVANPMRQQSAILRMHLLPGLLDAAALNLARHGRALGLFEVGRVYAWPPAGEDFQGPAGFPTAAVDAGLPHERSVAGIVLTGGVHGGDATPGFGPADAGTRLVDALHRVGLAASLRPVAPDERAPHLHPGVQVAVVVTDPGGVETVVGHAGAVHPDVLDGWDLPEGATPSYGELRVDRLAEIRPVALRSVPRFPATSRDVSLELDTAVPAHAVVHALRDAAVQVEAADGEDSTAQAGSAPTDPPRLAPGDRTGEAVDMLEDYRGEGIAPGRRALLLRLHYRAAGRSVEDAEVQARHDAIVETALSALQAGHDAQARRR